MPPAPSTSSSDHRLRRTRSLALSLARFVPAIALASLVTAVVGLMAAAAPASSPARAPAPSTRLDALAMDFTRIALALAQHKPDEVDSYFGPASLRPVAASTSAPAPMVSITTLSQRVHQLVSQLHREPSGAGDDRSRQDRLRAEARALAAVIDRPRISFDDEARLLYGMTLSEADRAPADARIDVALATLDRLLPRMAANSLAARFDDYRRRFIIPADRRRVVFDAAMAECRARTVSRWTLPAGEHLDVKWDISAGAAWHRYEGHGRSTLTINPAAVAFVDTAIDLACHEGYPGHHAQFLLADHGVATPVEETVALLRSPVAMMREAAANYAVDLAFSPDERLRFERETLFPLAGLESADADAATYFEVRRRLRELEPGIVPILRDYRDGRLSASEAADRLERRALMSNPQPLLQFVDDLGAYVLGYTVARDRLAAYVERQSHRDRDLDSDHGPDAWTSLRELLIRLDPATALSSTSSVPSSSPRFSSAAR